MVPDPFGRALRDFHRDEQDEPLRQRDGEDVREHPVESFYFDEVDPEAERTRWLESHLDGPLLDLGAGVGRDARYFQRQFETVAVEVSAPLVETMRARGVDDARPGDLFALRETFERDRFRSVLCYGTQLGLTKSPQGLRRVLSDLARVTTPDATAVVDNYDPRREPASDLLGYRDDPTRGVAFRVMQFEYEDEVGETLLFRLCSPDRLREATVGTGWTVVDVEYTEDAHYVAALEKLA